MIPSMVMPHPQPQPQHREANAEIIGEEETKAPRVNVVAAGEGEAYPGQWR